MKTRRKGTKTKPKARKIAPKASRKPKAKKRKTKAKLALVAPLVVVPASVPPPPDPIPVEHPEAVELGRRLFELDDDDDDDEDDYAPPPEPPRPRTPGRFEVKVVRPDRTTQGVEIFAAVSPHACIWRGVMGYGIIEDLRGRHTAYFMANWRTPDLLILHDEVEDRSW